MSENIDRPSSPADALAIIEQARSRAATTLVPNLVAQNGVWGGAYLVAGTLYYLHLLGVLSGLTTVLVCGAILVAAIAGGAVLSVRAARGVHSPFERQGAMYGIGWSVALLLTYGLTASIPGGASTPTVFVFVVGVLFLMSGVVWTSNAFYATGIWIMVIAVVAGFVPSPTHVLVLTVGAGGGMLGLAGVLARHRTPTA